MLIVGTVGPKRERPGHLSHHLGLPATPSGRWHGLDPDAPRTVPSSRGHLACPRPPRASPPPPPPRRPPSLSRDAAARGRCQPGGRRRVWSSGWRCVQLVLLTHFIHHGFCCYSLAPWGTILPSVWLRLAFYYIRLLRRPKSPLISGFMPILNSIQFNFICTVLFTVDCHKDALQIANQP